MSNQELIAQMERKIENVLTENIVDTVRVHFEEMPKDTEALRTNPDSMKALDKITAKNTAFYDKIREFISSLDEAHSNTLRNLSSHGLYSNPEGTRATIREVEKFGEVSEEMDLQSMQATLVNLIAKKLRD